MNYNKNYRFYDVFNMNINVFIFFFLCLFLAGNAFALEALNNDQIIAAQNNGMISAMCYVLDIITGSYARSIMAVFVVGTGWLFFTGAVKDWTTIFFFTLAITIMFGATEFANIISGNDYSCKKIYAVAEIDRNTIYNAGDCRIIDIPEYVPGQQWYTCSAFDSKKCEELITDDTIISVGNIVGLKLCEEGSFKVDDSIVPTYECKETSVNGEKVTKFSSNVDTEILRKGKCYSSCSLKSLKQVLSGRNAKSSSTKIGNYVILDNSGSFKANSYFTQGSIVDLDCNAGYIEYNNEGKIDANGLKAVCEGNNIFSLQGSCKSKCRISNTKYKDSVSIWQIYDETNKGWKDTQDLDFYYGDKIRIKTCNENKGYAFITTKDISGNVIPVKDEEKLVMTCGEGGAWNQEIIGNGQIGKVCSKNCSLENYRYYAVNKWKTDCNETGECQTDIKGGTAFQEGDVVGIDSCLERDYTILFNKDIWRLRLTCSASGEWVESNGTRCHKNCEVSSIPNFEFAESWVMCDEKENTNLGTNGEVKCEGVLKKNLPMVVEHGISLKQGACANNYMIDINEATTYICRDGEFHRKSGGSKDEVCRMGCRFITLKDIDGNGLIWFKSTANGKKYSDNDSDIINIDTDKGKTTAAKYGDYYALKNCRNDSMAVFSDAPVIVKCAEEGIWKTYKNENNTCHVGCVLASISKAGGVNDAIVAGWEIYDSGLNSYKPLTADTKLISNGSKIKPTSCTGDFSLNPNTTGSFYIQCKNGELVKSKKIELCYKRCKIAPVVKSAGRIVSEWLDTSTGKVVGADGSIDYKSGLAVNKCVKGTLQNRRAVFVCAEDGTLDEVDDNPIAAICLGN